MRKRNKKRGKIKAYFFGHPLSKAEVEARRRDAREYELNSDRLGPIE